jgi:hypothetical protein
LIVQLGHNKDHFSFDHDHFREFFLGEQIGRYLVGNDATDIRRLLKTDVVPAWSLDAALAFAYAQKVAVGALLEFLSAIARSDGLTSFLRENCGALCIRLLEKLAGFGGAVNELSFPIDALGGRSISDAKFVKCYFRPTSIDGSRLNKVLFVQCDFERLDLSGSSPVVAEMADCSVRSILVRQGADYAEIYDPERIRLFLERAGFVLNAKTGVPAFESYEIDRKLEIVQKVINTFRRCTQASEGVCVCDLARMQMSSLARSCLNYCVWEFWCELPIKAGALTSMLGWA